MLCFSQGVDVWSTDNFEENIYYEGYVVDIHNDTLRGFVRFTNRVDIQHEILFLKERDQLSSQVKYRPADLIGFGFVDKIYRCINYSGGSSSSAIKANLLAKVGCIEEYIWYEKAEGYSKMIKRPTESIKEFRNRRYISTRVYYNTNQRKAVDGDYFLLNRETKLLDFVKEDVELVNAMKNKRFNSDKLEEIFRAYNLSCGKSDSAE
jgi:hypothetical protein